MKKTIEKSLTDNFDKAIGRVLWLEGGYSNNPIDRGGETYKGIARNFHPNWEGWKIIDELHSEDNFPKNLEENAELNSFVKAFYKSEFWDKMQLDNYPESISSRVLDAAIHCGIKRAVRFIQNTINILNRNQRLYPNIKVDGIFGRKTKEAFVLCLKKNQVKLIYKILTLYQGARYLELMMLNEPYEIFVGWFNRIDVGES